MKLGLIAGRYAPEFEGGSEHLVRALARGLFARGHEVVIVTGTDLPLCERDVIREQVDGLELLRLPLASAEVFDLELERPRIEVLVEDALEGCELVHLHHWATLSQRLVRRLAPSLPVVVTLHDAFATCPRFFRASPLGLVCPPRGEFANCARCIAPEAGPVTPAELEARLERRARAFEAEIGAAARWIAPSELHAQRIAAMLQLDPARKCVIAPGLTRALRPLAPAERGPAGFLRILHFGNLCAEKGTLDLVKAIARLPAGTATLTLAGRALTPGLEAQVEHLRGAASVRIVGQYDAASLARLAAQSDLAVFPSRVHESYGLVLDEAHALGLPAWTSDRGGLRERLEAGERCLPAEDPESWARALAELALDPTPLRQIRARLRSRHIPTVEDSVRAHEELYTSVLESRPA